MANRKVEELVNERFDKFVGSSHLKEVLYYYIEKNVTETVTQKEIEKTISDCISKTISESYSTVDVSKLFICSYNDGNIGLFYRDSFIDAKALTNPIIYDIYNGFESDYIAIKKNMYHLDKPGTYDVLDCDINCLMEIDGNMKRANCKVTDCLGSFEEMRKMMRLDANIIKPYNIGYATREEISQVLDFVYNNLLKKSNKNR